MTVIAKLNNHSSPHPSQPQSLSYQFKTQRPSFPKWDVTPPTTSLFLSQIYTYKAEELYTDNSKSCSKLQSHILDGIAVCRDDWSNYVIFYNPITSSYYHPQDFRLNESRLPITNFPNFLRFDGGLTCGLLRNNTGPIHEPFPPGTRVSIQRSNTPAHVTIKNIPIPVSPILITEAYPSTETL